MTPNPPLSSEPDWVKVTDGSDKDWRLISMHELRKLEHAINEPCIGKNDGCPPGHLKEMHDSGNETIDKVRARKSIKASGATTAIPNSISGNSSDQFLCSNKVHSAIAAAAIEKRCHTCRTLQWDNRLIWSLEELLAWVRQNHMDQHDIRDHIDLLLGKYRIELSQRQATTKKDDRPGCTYKHLTGACTCQQITENPIPAPIYCPFDSQEGQQRFCNGYHGPIYRFDIVTGRMVECERL
jgi:hypothetical protein